MQGKLVEQKPEESTAKELLEQIKAEKEQLIIEGKIKREKPLAVITEDEIPFEIPESWEWVRLIDLSDACDVPFADGPFGSNLKSQHYVINPEVRIIQLSNIGEDGWKNENVKYTSFRHAETIKRSMVNSGEIVIAKMMPAGRAIKVPNIDNAYVLSSDAVKFVPHPLLNKKYLLNAINSNVFRRQIYSEVQGITRVRTSLTKIKTYLIPLPPLEEQKRIVAKLEELMPYVKKYGAAHAKLEALNKKFPEDMQKSILHYAIQGKLVEQRQEEGNAEELYQQIQAEKAKLIKVGKIKKEKPLPEITEDEIPFEIPENWKWVRLVNILSILGDGIHGTPNYDEIGEYYFINGNNLTDGKIEIKDNTKKVNYNEYKKYKKELNRNTVLVSINGTIGNVAFYNNEKVILGKSACYFNLLSEELKFYLYWLLKTKYFQDYAVKNATGSTIKNVSLATMKNFIVPLPPLAEQKRIVAKIEELLPYCQQLVK